MQYITFQYQNPQDLMLFLLVASRFGLTPIDENHEEENVGENMAACLRKLAGISAFESIQDPVRWQKNQRKETKLTGR